LQFSNALNNFFSSFSGLGTEDDLVAFFPSGQDKGLTRENMRSESSLDALESVDISFAESLDDELAGNTIGAETVQNRLVESSHSSHVGVNVQGVSVTSQSVEDSLVGNGLILNNLISNSFRDLGHNSVRISLEAKSTKASDEETHVVNKQGDSLAIIANFVGGDFKGDESTLALVGDIRDSASSNKLDVGLDGLEEFDFVFTVKKHHGVEFGHARAFSQGNKDLFDKEEGGTNSWENSKVLVKLISEFEVFFVHGVLGEADTEGVNDGIFGGEFGFDFLNGIVNDLIGNNFFRLAHV